MSNSYNIYSSYSGYGTAMIVGIIVSFILAAVGGIVLYFTFLSKKNEGKFNGFLGWLYDFLNFKKLMLETILKILYLIIACFITLYSLVVLFVGGTNFGTNFLSFLMILVIGHVVARVGYELTLLLVMICKNTSEINKKLGASKEEEETQNQQPQNMIYCSRCGKQYNENDGHCPNCGLK